MVDCYESITFLFLLIIPLTNSKSQSFNFPYFSQMNVNLNQIKLEGNASISGSSIQLTTEHVGNDSTNGVGTIGRVRYHEYIHLWDNNTGQQVDFTTNFSFVISSSEGAYGDGLMFFLANPELLNENMMVKQAGGGLGIDVVDGNQNILVDGYNQFVALEFDTFSNDWDPDGAHVGLNVNSVMSVILEEWSTDIPNDRVYNCSVEYNSRSSYLNVSFTGYGFEGVPITKYFGYHINITEHLPESVVIGISASTGGYSENHTILSWSFSTSRGPMIVDTKKVRRIIINPRLLEGVVIGVVLPLSLLGLVHVLLWMMNKGKKEESSSETGSVVKMDYEFQMSTGPKKICYYELLNATNNFEEKHKLGQGGFGGVYKGYLKRTNSYAAIKRISSDSRQGIKQYAAEVMIISQLRHRNLLKLIGWCHRNHDFILIYEFMPNGSLDSHLFRGESILPWNLRYNIALGLASALLYLQEEWEKCVIHRDIKSSNIMLDSNFNTKLGDFGLARLMDHEKVSETTHVAGTIGYLAPEYMKTGKARKESDIFSFGVVLLEIATGRKAILQQDWDLEGQVSLVEWVWELYALKNIIAAADPKLCEVFDVKQMECLLVVGLWCANPDSSSRPSIREAINVLNFEAPLPILPQNVPMLALFPPIRRNDIFYSVPSFFRTTTG
ncbi:L-type lectin-domain containing receptor kinase IX.1-like [Cicer arietinum]|uniref:L-type lectin-domain containing receptor kinase IX.1-like n=1 Tax=Cicer arietinum TaxID=3827 RepID=A0A1S3E9B0_CICAR|nr:L-type lectin-domain containing receptor kinase IX.1-like [Cicer arietinum]